MEGAHTLTGDREGKWSLSVTANRRLTPRIHTAEHEIYDVNLEDYQ
jgi:proteic killer suppression protein